MTQTVSPMPVLPAAATPAAPPAAPTFGQAIRMGFYAAKVNVLPGTLLQLAAAAIVLSYYFTQTGHDLLEHVAQLKTRYGYIYSVVCTACFGSLLPIALASIMPGGRHRAEVIAARRSIVYLTCFWALVGLQVDGLYRAEAWAFGESGVRAVVSKVAFDQGLFTTIYALPLTVLVYQFKDAGYDRRRMRIRPIGHWYRLYVMPLMVSNWGVWLPAVVLIYCLPLALQLPIQNVVQCLWSLMILVLARPAEAPPQPLAA
ncbi:MAG: hypothetical protein GC162_09225 [Planctomycetes bacterium]|nr:hypothetical protein [Planctomycetota bacterium]